MMTTFRLSMIAGCLMAGMIAAPAIAAQTMQEMGAAKSQEAQRKSYEEQLAAWLDKHKIYSKEARRQQIEGSARVELRIDATGKVLEHKVLDKTGFALIDDTIEKGIREAGKAPVPPKGAYADLADRTFEVQIDYLIR